MQDHRAGIDIRRAFQRLSLVQWAVTATTLLVVAVLVPTTRLDVLLATVSPQIIASAALTLVTLVYTFRRFDLRIALLSDTFAQLAAFSTVAGILSYVAAALGAWSALQDDALLRFDRALGFDWLAFLRWLTSHPVLARGLGLAYNSILWQAVALLLLLSAMRSARRLQTFVLAFQITALACILISALVPALGTYEHLGIRQAVDHPGIELTTMSHHVATVTRLRDATQTLPLTQILGIITFPSLHMGLAVLFAWGFWAVPALRWATLALNVLMGVATPLYGSHYMADLLAGAALAVAAIIVAEAMARRACGPATSRDHAPSRLVVAYAPSSSG